MQSAHPHYDVVVIGGGIHGVSMACEAASRELKVLLLQARDLGAGASSATSTLISGDLRKLEAGHWGEVYRNLQEQRLFHRRAPHLAQYRTYYIAPSPGVRSERKVKLGLWVYRQMQGKARSPSSAVANPEAPLHNKHGLLQYQDCSALDYRVVVSTALLAKHWGADIQPRTAVVAAQRQRNLWQLTLKRDNHAEPTTVTAGVVINAAGSMANDLLENVLQAPSRCRASPVYFGQIVVRKSYAGQQGYVLQAPDRRLIYVTPLRQNHLLVGPCIAHKEADKNQAVKQVVALFNQHFTGQIVIDDIEHVRWATRAVLDDPSATDTTSVMDSLLDLNSPYGSAPLLNVFGINFVMHRLLAERGLDILKPFTDRGVNSALKSQPLPGGDIPDNDMVAFIQEITAAYPRLERGLLIRLAETYGSLAYQILEGRDQVAALGLHFGHKLYEAEVRYLLTHEWALTAEDILWRRTQLGLVFQPDEVAALERWLTHR